MRVLHMPANISSQLSITVRALREIGIDARGITGGSALQDASGVRVIPDGGRWTLPVIRGLLRCDVVHWHYESVFSNGRDLWLARKLRKPGIVEFWGSEIRFPEAEEKINPYYANRGQGYEYNAAETRDQSYARQDAFSHAGVTTCFAYHGAEKFLKPGAFKTVYRTWGRVPIDDFAAAVPSATQATPPLIVHSPSMKGAKGTEAVLSAVEELRARGLDFEFRLVHGVKREEALRNVQECDIYADQFVLGSYGLAAIEAMAFGKPVLSYLTPHQRSQFPPELPVICTAQPDIANELERLIRNPQLRHDVGLRSRRYAETYHNAHRHALWLRDIYKGLREGLTDRVFPYPATLE